MRSLIPYLSTLTTSLATLQFTDLTAIWAIAFCRMSAIASLLTPQSCFSL
ncbi:hypothetical protein [Coleofasciculus sp. FACHB-501]|nr:hypothetical protein [Coleofasciculus sp. FACHB-501]MBD1838860.1 hypothetical protein [Coleofasciculus sp. FACHB-501]